MTKRRKKQTTMTAADTELLRDIQAQLDRIESGIDRSQQKAIKSGAIAGGLSGGLSGGLVALGIAFIKAKLEL